MKHRFALAQERRRQRVDALSIPCWNVKRQEATIGNKGLFVDDVKRRVKIIKNQLNRKANLFAPSNSYNLLKFTGPPKAYSFTFKFP